MTQIKSSEAPTRYHFSVEDYHRMGDAGIFTEDDRVELLDGEIFVMSPIGVRHAYCVRTQSHLVEQQLGEEAVVSSQQPVISTGIRNRSRTSPC